MSPRRNQPEGLPLSDAHFDLGNETREVGEVQPTAELRSDWIAFDENGISHDVSSINIKTTFRLDNPNSMPSQGKYVSDQALVMTYGDDYPMITIYCSLLGLVILTLLIYVFYKLWQQRFSIEDAKSLEAGGFHPAFTGLKSVGNRTKNCKVSGSTKNTFDHQRLLEEQQQQQQHQQQRQRSYAPLNANISEAFLKDLALELSSEDRWKQVGGSLGFNEEELRNFENAKPKEDSQSLGDAHKAAAQKLLTTWYSRSLGTDPDPLLSLMTALERTPGAGNSYQRLKEHLQSAGAPLQVSQTDTLPSVQTINH